MHPFVMHEISWQDGFRQEEATDPPAQGGDTWSFTAHSGRCGGKAAVRRTRDPLAADVRDPTHCRVVVA